ncbi:tetratricopeptide repeat-containing glycosyltransferase family 2 protein [Paenibacillus sp. Marseille-Q7038]
MPSQTISLCMIVKDEEQMLPACLESVQGAVDEIIVVDTGSTDNTVQLAERYGASVVHFKWCHDFAAARNAGLEAATGDWILFLDADERIDEQGVQELPIWAQQDGVEGYFLQIHNYTGNGSGGVTINPVLRMFRHRPEYRFQGRIHEQIAESIVSQCAEAHFHMTDVIIHHYGYSETIVSAKNKVNRNMQLLQQIIEEDPANPFHDYNLGVEYLRMGEVQQALGYFQKSWNGLDPARVSYAHLVLKYEVRCLQALGQWKEAMEKITKGRSLYPGYTDLLHAQAFTQNTLGRAEEAEKILREALHMGPSAEMYHTEEGIGTFQTWFMLGQYAEQREALEEAVDAYVEAVRYKPSLLPPLYRICRILQVTGQEERLPKLIEARFRIESQEAMGKLIRILNDSRCYSAVLSILKQWDQPSIPRETIRVSKIMALWRCGDWENAALLLRKNDDFPDQEKDWLMWSLDIAPSIGQKRAIKDHAILLIEQGEDEELKPLTEGTWTSFAELLEAADHAGKREMFVGVTGAWRNTLEKNREVMPEAVLMGTQKYVSSMTSAADGHLSVIQAQAPYDVNTRPVQHIRLGLPWPNGFR